MEYEAGIERKLRRQCFRCIGGLRRLRHWNGDTGVYLFSEIKTPGIFGGVHCLSWKGLTVERLRSLGLSVFVSLLSVMDGKPCFFLM